MDHRRPAHRPHLSRIYALGWIHLHDDPPATAGGLLDAHGNEKPGYFAWRNG